MVLKAELQGSNGLGISGPTGTAFEKCQLDGTAVSELPADIRIPELEDGNLGSQPSPNTLYPLGLWQEAKYNTTCSMNEIDEATETHRQILQRLSDEDDDIDKMTSWADLGLALKARLSIEIRNFLRVLFMDAAQMSDNIDPSKANYLKNHGNALLWKFHRDPSLLDDLDAAVKAPDDAVVYTSTTDSTRLPLRLGRHRRLEIPEDGLQK
ncbi:hypothetical protein ACHAQJ_002207 [Trichoderma viride]